MVIGGQLVVADENALWTPVEKSQTIYLNIQQILMIGEHWMVIGGQLVAAEDGNCPEMVMVDYKMI